MDFPFVLPYNKRNYRPQGKRRTTMLYPIMNRSRSLIDLRGVWQFQLGDEKEPGRYLDRTPGDGNDLRSGLLQ